MGKSFGLAWRMWVAVAAVVVVGGCTAILGVDNEYTLVAEGGGGSSSSTAMSSSGTGGAACVPMDDSNPCTDDVCDNGVPKSTPTAASSPCSVGGTQSLSNN